MEEEPKIGHSASSKSGVASTTVAEEGGRGVAENTGGVDRPTNFTIASTAQESEASSSAQPATILGRQQKGARGEASQTETTGTSVITSSIPSQAMQDPDRPMAPSSAVITALDDVLQCQFGEIAEDPNEDNDGEPKAGKKMVRIADLNQDDIKSVEGVQRSSLKDRNSFTVGDAKHRRDSTEAKQELGIQSKTACVRLAENNWFVSIFMMLTFYALFVPDLDLLFGSKDSKFTFSIVTFVVCVLFVFEIIVQSLGRAQYFLGAYFWLDLIAMASLLPDTWLFQAVINTNAFVAGRSSRLTRIIRIASRSSKATRLNRLTRIVRVASLMPKCAALLGRKVKDDDTEKMLEKKLRRVFHFLDEDMDGMISRTAALSCVEKMKADEPTKGPSRLWKAESVKNLFKKKPRSESSLSVDKNNEKKIQKSITSSDEAEFQEKESAGPTKSVLSGGSMARTPTKESKVLKKAKSDAENGKTTITSQGQPQLNNAPSRDIEATGTGKTEASLAPAPSTPSAKRRPKKCFTTVSKTEGGNTDDEGDPFDLVSFKEFREIMVTDAWIYDKLKRACQQQLKQGNNMQNLTSRHSEYIAVKVALGVLLLLFVLSRRAGC
jgi:hypothetical protein